MVLQEKIQQWDTHGTVKTTSERKSVQQIANNVRTKPGRKSIPRHLEHHKLRRVKQKPSLQTNEDYLQDLKGTTLHCLFWWIPTIVHTNIIEQTQKNYKIRSISDCPTQPALVQLSPSPFVYAKSAPSGHPWRPGLKGLATMHSGCFTSPQFPPSFLCSFSPQKIMHFDPRLLLLPKMHWR